MSARILVDVRCGASDGHVHRMESAVSNETAEGRVVMMCGGGVSLAMVPCLGGVRQWDEHEQFFCISNYLIAELCVF